MKKIILLGVTVATTLVGCSQLQSQDIALDLQRFANCSFQGAVYKGENGTSLDNKVYTDLSARCDIIKDDSFNDVTASPVLQKRNSSTGAWSSVAFGTRVKRTEQSNGNEVYTWSHLKAIGPCSTSSQTGTYRGSMVITSYDELGNPGDQGVYYSPTKVVNCP